MKISHMQFSILFRFFTYCDNSEKITLKRVYVISLFIENFHHHIILNLNVQELGQLID